MMIISGMSIGMLSLTLLRNSPTSLGFLDHVCIFVGRIMDFDLTTKKSCPIPTPIS